MKKAIIIGGGLAGCEAAFQLLTRGWAVELKEMRPLKTTPAHRTGALAELVCSNSLRSDDAETNAVGLLHEEMRRAGSLIMAAADASRVPAGGALAVNREEFSRFVENKLTAFEGFERITAEADFPLESDCPVIVATGPLTSDAFAEQLRALTGEKSLHFFDAIAPIVYRDSVDMSRAWYQSRYDKGDGEDYLNCPLTKEEYNLFLDALEAAEKVSFKEWEKTTPYFEGCLPIEVMAARGRQTLLFGPMKPVGLSNPFEGGRRPFAVVQLRKENRSGELMNLVGFQTKLTYGAQQEVFRLIPALKNAVFARLGGIHRNTFVCGPRVLTDKMTLKACPHVRLAGQLTGCEGYVESAATGLLAGLFTALPEAPLPPLETALGAMLAHITRLGEAEVFQPMNINFGLFPPLPETPGARRLKGADRKKAMSVRAREALTPWLETV